MANIRVLLADSSDAFVSSMVSLLASQSEFELTGCCRSGGELVTSVLTDPPDVVLLDPILCGMDGYSAMRALSGERSRVAFVVCTSFFNEFSVRLARDCGARAFLCKPVQELSVLNTLRDAACAERQELLRTESDESGLNQQDSAITGFLMRHGVPQQSEGFRMLRDAVRMALTYPELMESVTKRLYPEIARRYRSTPIRVERNLRSAISRAYEKGRLLLNGRRPTNREAIAYLASMVLKAEEDAQRTHILG